MKILAIIGLILFGGYLVDQRFNHGRFFGGASEMSRQIAASFGLRR